MRFEAYLWISMTSSYLFWGIICPLLPEVIVIWVFTRWHFLASTLLIISYVIKHLCEETSYIKLGEVTWCKSNKFSHVFWDPEEQRNSQRGNQSIISFKRFEENNIWIRSKSRQLSHSTVNIWWWCFSTVVAQESLSLGVYGLIHTHPFFPGSKLQVTTDSWEGRQLKLSIKAKTSSNPNVQCMPK